MQPSGKSDTMPLGHLVSYLPPWGNASPNDGPLWRGAVRTTGTSRHSLPSILPSPRDGQDACSYTYASSAPPVILIPRLAKPCPAPMFLALPSPAGPCQAVPRPAMPGRAKPRCSSPCHARPCHAGPRPAQPRLARPCHAAPRCSSPRQAPPCPASPCLA